MLYCKMHAAKLRPYYYFPPESHSTKRFSISSDMISLLPFSEVNITHRKHYVGVL